MNRIQFIAALAPDAIQAWREGSPLFPSVRLAQNILETGAEIHPWFNLGGIKAGSGTPNPWWDGRTIAKPTWEEYNGRRVETVAYFRVYSSVYNFYKDQDRLLSTNRYHRVRLSKTPEEQAAMLQACGYATDSAYPGKLVSLIRSNDLVQYDREDEDKLEMTKYQRDTLVATLQKLLERKVINDPAWIEKAKSGTLSLSELTWLNTILVANK
ncbi:glucosaminidase domain-containing protein [Paenibacillus sp. sptzw28]|uniref:glycoside hydrolase family 73 protein n=1 Tax=Paenibacillus sp. sptzw28 TaxID=715179 RepID=UPI001C6DFE01|nr:glucosaminidase domain-containing protein [Paenibacillus sp. sptzw28]QYR20790.1 glucosaminidase domain-containing protein [Paenibacillus sp. sptzw28]